ncbi:AHH domain-containing protein [Psychrobacter lutiphocae]|uniref:AHH domain-containing protein n=1 Tax=Psychrobacter lutiphocae TaxID=540500 RepID=UPI0003759DB9|nr:AHH domain-containing protein [Psychrobacter lutiphocae]
MSIITQSHHIFTKKFYKEFGVKLSEIFDNESLIGQDDYSNRIRLFEDANMADAIKNTLAANPDALNGTNMGATNHSGDHPNYSDAISNAVVEVIQDYNDKVINQQHAQNLVLDIHQTANPNFLLRT